MANLTSNTLFRLLLAGLIVSLATACMHTRKYDAQIQKELEAEQMALCEKDHRTCITTKVTEKRSFFKRELSTKTINGESISSDVFSWAPLAEVAVAAPFLPCAACCTGPVSLLISPLFTKGGPHGGLPCMIAAVYGFAWPFWLSGSAYKHLQKEERMVALKNLAEVRTQQKLDMIGERRFTIAAKAKRARKDIDDDQLKQTMEILARTDCPGTDAHLHFQIGKSSELVFVPNSSPSESATCLSKAIKLANLVQYWDLEIEAHAKKNPAEPSIHSKQESIPVELRPPSPATQWIPQAKRFSASATHTDVKLSSPCTHTALRQMNLEALNFLRNEVFARHGRVFESERLKSHFGTQDWYHARADHEDDDLSLADRACVARILLWEKGLVLLAEEVDLDDDGHPELVALINHTRPHGIKEKQNSLLIINDIEVPFWVPPGAFNNAHIQRMSVRPFASLHRGGKYFDTVFPILKGAGRVLMLEQTIVEGDESLLTVVNLQDHQAVVHSFSHQGHYVHVTEDGVLQWFATDSAYVGEWCFYLSWGEPRLKLEHEDWFNFVARAG